MPKVLSKQDHEAIAQLQLFARGVVEGLTAGQHRSPHKGTSAEFKEHRQYVHGDELRSIDWKLFGKTDRLYIRQYEDETNLNAMLLLDQSGSMAYRGSRTDVSKHKYAVQLAACFATLLMAQQDAIGLTTFDSCVRDVIPPRSRTSHLREILATLSTSKPENETALSQVLQSVATQTKRRSLLILLSDCFDSVPSLLTSLSYFRHMGSEVILFQIFAPDELDFPFSSQTQFQSLEKTDHQRIVDPRSLRDSYLKRLEQFQAELRDGCARKRIDLITCTTDTNHAEVLSRYINQRSNGLTALLDSRSGAASASQRKSAQRGKL